MSNERIDNNNYYNRNYKPNHDYRVTKKSSQILLLSTGQLSHSYKKGNISEINSLITDMLF